MNDRFHFFTLLNNKKEMTDKKISQYASKYPHHKYIFNTMKSHMNSTHVVMEIHSFSGLLVLHMCICIREDVWSKKIQGGTVIHNLSSME